MVLSGRVVGTTDRKGSSLRDGGRGLRMSCQHGIMKESVGTAYLAQRSRRGKVVHEPALRTARMRSTALFDRVFPPLCDRRLRYWLGNRLVGKAKRGLDDVEESSQSRLETTFSVNNLLRLLFNVFSRSCLSVMASPSSLLTLKISMMSPI
ncbi:hypothetical protein BKA80DRAFT_266231 [Phyllosticta citrichinensis]